MSQPTPDEGEVLVVEKHRHRLDGRETVVYYACGLQRATKEEALADAVKIQALLRGETK